LAGAGINFSRAHGRTRFGALIYDRIF
jgi:hypothetical protein